MTADVSRMDDIELAYIVARHAHHDAVTGWNATQGGVTEQVCRGCAMAWPCDAEMAAREALARGAEVQP